MQDLNDKTTGNSLSADEWNQQPSEIQNIITQRGIVLSGGDLDQLGKAIAGYVANGSFFVDSGVANLYLLATVDNIQAAPNYRDGDEISFFPANANTGASTVNRAAVGGINLKDQFGSELTANALTPDSLAVARFIAGEFRLQPSLNVAIQSKLKSGRKNALINGDFQVSQRGNSFVPDTSDYTIDRWLFSASLFGGALTAPTVSKETFLIGQTDVSDNPKNYMDFSGYVVGGDTNEICRVLQSVENVSTFSGQQVTLSFWVKGTIVGNIGANVQQNFGQGGGESPAVFPLGETIPITTSWQKVTKTFLMTSVNGKTLGATPQRDRLLIGLITNIGSAQAVIFGQPDPILYTGVVSVADVQLEKGGFATDFDRMESAIQRTMCERYYQRYSMTGNSPYMGRGNGGSINSTPISLTVSMRTLPTCIPNFNETPLARIVSGGGGNVGGGIAINYGAISSNQFRANLTVANNNNALYWLDYGGFGHTVQCIAEF